MNCLNKDNHGAKNRNIVMTLTKITTETMTTREITLDGEEITDGDTETHETGKLEDVGTATR